MRITFFPAALNAVTYQAVMLQGVNSHQLHSITQTLGEQAVADESKWGRVWAGVFPFTGITLCTKQGRQGCNSVLG